MNESQQLDDLRLIMSGIFTSLKHEDYSKKVLKCRRTELSSYARFAIKMFISVGKTERALLVLHELNNRFTELHEEGELPYTDLIN